MTPATIELFENKFEYYAKKIDHLPENWKEIAIMGQRSNEYIELRKKFHNENYEFAVEMILNLYNAFSCKYIDYCSNERFEQLHKAINNNESEPCALETMIDS